MALFTSYRALNTVYGHLRSRLKGVRILLQGELPKSKIIEEFKKDQNSLILATSSFWQGVDIPGQALSCVFIDKFPFLPPSDPVLSYLQKTAPDGGKSVFIDYSVPKAIIALKQGVGRLIRTEDDYGVVVLCDNRIATTGYGAQFRKAFPGEGGCLFSEDGNLDHVSAFLQEMSQLTNAKRRS